MPARGETRSHRRSSKGSTELLPPPRAQHLAGWALLPLRAFLGVTFTFAGLQKLANPNFFDPNSPISIQAQLLASIRVSPLHQLLGHFLQFATPIGILISLGEIAVGVGMLLGLWTRLAAVGGALLALMLFLTVSFHASPYFTGADIVFLFAFLPFIVAGAAGAPSLDRRLAKRASEELGFGDPTPYVLPFSKVQDLCGSYDAGRCRAQRGRPCAPVGCPVLEPTSAESTSVLKPDEVDRRTVVLGASAVAVAGAVGVVIAGSAAGLGRAIGAAPKEKSSTNTLTPQATTTTAPGNSVTPTTSLGTAIGSASSVPVGGAGSFTLPSGDPGLVLQPAKDTFVAYDAVCPHAGCTVGFSKAADLIACPCHGSEFKVSNGDVIVGPSPHGLTAYTVTKGSDGQLYIKA